MNYTPEHAKRDAEFFKAFKKDRTLDRATWNKNNPISTPKNKPTWCDKPNQFDEIPRFFSEAISPSPLHEKLYKGLGDYVKKFPAVSTPNLFLSGATGTGKTYTAKIIANALSDKGIDVHFTTAFAMVNAFQKYVTSFGRDDYLLEELLESQILIIDDLGAEPVIRNVTQEHIYNIINERLVNNRAFIITTNLTPAQIKERYDQRITSRILADATTTCLEFKGNDLRLKPKD